ncbi:MAG: GTPase, partial [Phycisphaerae bacterium]
HVVLAGLPNAGKSTLFNALVGSERSIVSPLIGTTRDIVSATLRTKQAEFVLQDTAGVVESSTTLDVAAGELTHAAGEYADLVIWVHAECAEWTTAEWTTFTALAPERTLLIHSKADQKSENSELQRPPDTSEGSPLRVSAVTGAGIDHLRTAIDERLARRRTESTLPPSRAYGRALEALTRIIESCHAGPGHQSFELVAEDLRYAIQVLAASNSLTDPEALLGRIFTQFCIGK